MRAILRFSRTKTGLVLGDLTVNLLWLKSDPTTSQVGVLDVGATLEEIGLGHYAFNAPLVTEEGGISVTETGGEYADGIFDPTPALEQTSQYILTRITTALKRIQAGFIGVEQIGDNPVASYSVAIPTGASVTLYAFYENEETPWSVPIGVLDDSGWTVDPLYQSNPVGAVLGCDCVQGATLPFPSGTLTLTSDDGFDVEVRLPEQKSGMLLYPTRDGQVHSYGGAFEIVAAAGGTGATIEEIEALGLAQEATLDDLLLHIIPDLAQPTAPYLCTRASVKAALKIPTSNTAMDDDVDACIVASSEWIERFCRQTFSLYERTVYFSPGNEPAVMKGNRKLAFPFNVVSVTSLYQDSAREFGEDTLIAAEDYYLRGNVLCLYDDGLTGTFSTGDRTVKAVVQGGYAEIPQLLQRAAAMLATWIYSLAEKMRSNVASESVGGHTVSYKDEDMPKAVKAMLEGGGFVRQ